MKYEYKLHLLQHSQENNAVHQTLIYLYRKLQVMTIQNW